MELLGAYGWQGITLAIWFGLSVGSFLNVVIYRMPVMLRREWHAQATEILVEDGTIPPPAETPAGDAFNLMVPRSRCPSCGHQIRAWENIPVLSWLWLRGKCRYCKVPISPRYPGIELLTALLSLAAVPASSKSGVAAIVPPTPTLYTSDQVLPSR